MTDLSDANDAFNAAQADAPASDPNAVSMTPDGTINLPVEQQPGVDPAFAPQQEVIPPAPAQAPPDDPRISGLTHALREERRQRQEEATRAAMLQGQLQAMQQMMAPQQQQPQAPQQPPPRPDPFVDPEGAARWDQAMQQHQMQQMAAQVRQEAFEAAQHAVRQEIQTRTVRDTWEQLNATQPETAKAVSEWGARLPPEQKAWLWQQPNPTQAMVAEYNRQQIFSQYGTDPTQVQIRAAQSALTNPQVLQQLIQQNPAIGQTLAALARTGTPPPQNIPRPLAGMSQTVTNAPMGDANDDFNAMLRGR